MNKKAEMGIGTLIIFIAMILVAAIAAGVLIQTATSLQNRALLTGTRTQGQVSTALQYLAVYAENGSSSDKTVDDFFINAKLAAGSDAIKLEDALMELSLQDTSANLNYAGTEYNCTRIDGDPENSGYYTEGTDGNFSVEYLVKGSEGQDGYLEAGDVVRICVMAPRPVGPDENIHLRFIPQVGNPAVMETSVPDTITQTRVHIFP
ncbi:MAG: archaellin/type IV pilin N-terminal domain-containing protein [Candidatus Woesearchaeota archaeon]